mmetsp:Transcript_17468/g.37759  ORF Transcript_17468/g.37759 Transcript_17468/m.37759 type:complete len:119 (-) Transcript_17468:723-1079(-)
MKGTEFISEEATKQICFQSIVQHEVPSTIWKCSDLQYEASSSKKSSATDSKTELIFFPTALLATFGKGNQTSISLSSDILTFASWSPLSCSSPFPTESKGTDENLQTSFEQSIHSEPL